MTEISINNNKDDVWFVYDGECPICTSASRAYRIKEALGNLYTIDARADKNHPIMKEINSLGLNIDQGMVIKFKNTHYHGVEALHIMALLGTNSGLFNRLIPKFITLWLRQRTEIKDFSDTNVHLKMNIGIIPFPKTLSPLGRTEIKDFSDTITRLKMRNGIILYLALRCQTCLNINVGISKISCGRRRR